jgi:uncharacterized protein YkwD
MHIRNVSRAIVLSLAVVMMSVVFGGVVAWSAEPGGNAPPANFTAWRRPPYDPADDARHFALLRAERQARRIDAIRDYGDRAEWFAAVRGPTFEQVLKFFDVLLSSAPHQADPGLFTAASLPSTEAAVPVEHEPEPSTEPADPPAPAAAPSRPAAPPSPTRTPAPPPPQPPAAVADVWTDADFTRAVWDGVNARRTRAGLAAVAEDGRLSRAALDYAVQMSETDWFSHTGPDGSSFVDRIVAAGFPFDGQVGEILAMGTNGWPAADVVQAWIDSPPHREQMLNSNYSLAGIGCAFTREDGSLVVRCAMEFAA